MHIVGIEQRQQRIGLRVQVTRGARSGEQQPAESWDTFADRLAAEARERRVG